MGTISQSFLLSMSPGFFDVEGKVLNGPPPRPLDEFRVEIKII